MPQPDDSLVFDDVAIDFAGHRLLRGGIEQPLEPKAFAVLALLSGSPGKVFARDDILDAVWGHRHVTPGVLNRVMTLLRHALGEDAHAPRYLHTLHGVGYRFDLPAVTALPEPAVGTPATPEAAIAEAILCSLNQPALPRLRATDVARSPEPHARLRSLFWLVPPLALLLAGAWYFRPRAPFVATAPMPAAVTPATKLSLVVMPLKPIGEGNGVRTIADGLSEELIGELAQIEGLRVIARESTRLAATESTNSTQLAKRLGITHLLEGSLQQAGQSLRVRLRLVDAGSGSALWTRAFDRDASEVLLMQREIARAVAASLTLKLGLTVNPGKSGDAEFLRRYLVAKMPMDRIVLPSEQSIEVAENEFRALLRERPDDARVHASLAVALYFRTIRRPSQASVPALRDEALHEAAIALQLDPNLPEPYVVQGNAACNVDDWERCLELLDKALALGASQRDFARYAFALARLGYLHRAEMTLRESIARDPINGRLHFILGRILDTLGRHDEARRRFAEHRTSNDRYARWFNAVWRRDYAGALRIAETEMGARDDSDIYGDLLKPGHIAGSRALIDPVLWPRAIVAAREFEQKTGLMGFILLLAPDAPDHAPELIAKLNVARRLSYSSWDLLLWTKDLAYLRRDPAFQAYLKDSGILDYWRKHGFPKQCRPQDDGAVCE